MRFFKRKNTYIEIDPDEIFLDSSNLPEFDRSQFEGRIERPIGRSAAVSLGIFFALAVTLFSIRIANLEIVNGQSFLARSEANHLDKIPIFAERGVIYDRNSIQLAWNEPLARDGSSTEEYAKRAYTPMPGFVHMLGYVQYPLIDASGAFSAERFEGQAGVEKTFNSLLAGHNGQELVEVDAGQNIQSEDKIEPPQDGNDLVLTVDSHIQAEMAKEIASLAKRVGFTGGAGAVMDVHTGEVIALSSYPEYDPAVISLGQNKDEISRELGDIAGKPFLNRFISGLYTPGSIVKPVFALAALNEHLIAPTKQILSTGALVMPNPYHPDQPSVFKDWKAHGWEDMYKAIAESSDEYFYIIGGGYKDQSGLGIGRLDKYAELFGYAEKTGIALPSESDGTIPTPEWKAANFDGAQWLLGDTYHSSIGQYGWQVTPAQALRAVAAIANGGTLLVPQLVRAVVPPGINASTSLAHRAASPPSPVVYRHIGIPESDFNIVREGMRDGVLRGVASGLNSPAVDIAAKTGTAELGASKAYVNSWVTGFWPYAHPRYAFTIVMEHGPRANTTGALYVMRQLIDWMAVNTPDYLKDASSTPSK